MKSFKLMLNICISLAEMTWLPTTRFHKTCRKGFKKPWKSYHYYHLFIHGLPVKIEIENIIEKSTNMCSDHKRNTNLSHVSSET